MRAPKLDPTAAALTKHNRPKMSLSNLIYTLFLSGLLFAVEAACLAHILIVPPCHALGIGENYPLRLIGYHYVFLYFEERKIQQHAIGWGKNDSSKFSRQTQGFFFQTQLELNVGCVNK